MRLLWPSEPLAAKLIKGWSLKCVHTHTHTQCVEVHSKKLYIYNLIYIRFMFISLQRSGAASVLMFRLLISGGFCCFGGWVPGMCTSVAAAATWAQLLCEGWVLAGPGIKPRFPVLAWSFHTVETAAAPSSRGREGACLPGQARRPPSMWLLHKVPDFGG